MKAIKASFKSAERFGDSIFLLWFLFRMGMEEPKLSLHSRKGKLAQIKNYNLGDKFDLC